MNTTNKVTPGSGRADANRQTAGRRLRIALLGLAVVLAAACGNKAADSAGTAALTSTATTATSSTVPPNSTTASAPASTTTSPAPASIETVARPTATIDELVGPEGKRVHIRCVGHGPTTVLLVAGFEAGAGGWLKIEPLLAERSRVCSYERPGTGTSDPPAATQTFVSQATDLHSLLTTIGEPGPYVVVGHSFGGAEAVTFTSMFANEVKGLALIDASPATWPTDLCAIADDGSDSATAVGSNCAGWADPNGNAEHLDVFGSFEKVAGVSSLGSTPMAVITAVERPFTGLSTAELARLTQAWDNGQQRWSELSAASHVVPVDHTGHHIELDRPEVVVSEITRLLP
jgi:pimeloyl-ACP methyl ester carboxylesterase